METFQLTRSIMDALGAKRFAAAVGRTAQTVYTWTRDPNDPQVDGERGLLDWFEAVVDALAARPEGRPVLIQIRIAVVGMIDRALGAWKPQPLTQATLAAETSRVLREFSDLVGACGSEKLCAHAVQKEGAEVIEAVQRLMRATESGIMQDLEARSLRAG